MARRPGLGQGLGALIPGDDAQGQNRQTSSGIAQIPIEDISPNPHQPRIEMDEETIRELAESIREYGIIQPLIVSKETGQDGYILIAGERRWKAAKTVGLSMVPAIIREVTEQGQLEIALIENLQREDLTPLETAGAYQQLADNFALTHEQIAARVGKSRTSVTNTLRLLNLPDQVKNSLAEGLITVGHARALLGLSSAQAQRAALSTVLNLGLNVRQTESLVKKLNGDRLPPRLKSQPSPEIKALEDRLRQHFGTKVNLQDRKNGGSLVIFYYSDEELNTILDKILPGSST
jgi:ParB family chromosome partitioning protein